MTLAVDLNHGIFALPPRFGGLLGEDLGAEVRVGTFMKLIADLEASWRKTPTLKKPRERPTPGGSAEGTGGLSHALLDPQQASLRAKNLAPNARSAPLLRRSRNTGGPRTSDSEGRGGCGGAFGCAEPE